MPSKPKASPARPALYVAHRPDVEELTKKGAAYAHPWIRVGHGYGDDAPDYFWQEFTVEFQINLKASGDGVLTGHAYGGHLPNINLEEVLAAVKVIQRVNAKAELLAAGQPDQYFRFVVGLRGAGYKEAVMKQGDSHGIAFLR